MRKLIVCNVMSLDGRYEAPGKNIMPMFDYLPLYPPDESFDQYNAEQLRAADTLLLGRTSFEGFKSYWPPVADDSNAPAIAREISRRNNAIQKVVVSDTLTPDQLAPWHNTRIIRRADAFQQINELKRQPGKNILIFGSHSLWTDLLAHGLVNELHLLVAPIMLGAGTPVFDSPSALPLLLTDTRTWPGSGLVLLRYSVVHGAAQPNHIETAESTGR